MLKRFFVFLLLLILLTNTIDAKSGVGIVWMTEVETAYENTRHCIDYGLYNPWDEDIKVSLKVGGELSSIISDINSPVQTIKSFTSSKDPVISRICFKIPEVYEKNCILGALLCEKKCEEPEVKYDGYISAKEEKIDEFDKSGSSVALDVAAPLKIKVACEKTERSYTILIVILIILILLALIAWFIIKKKKRYTPQQYPVYK